MGHKVRAGDPPSKSLAAGSRFRGEIQRGVFTCFFGEKDLYHQVSAPENTIGAGGKGREGLPRQAFPAEYFFN